MDDDAATTDDDKGAAADGADLASMINKLGQAERLVVFGAAIMVVDFIIFELILKEYFTATVLLLVAGFVLTAAWIQHNRPEAVWPLPYGWLMRVLGTTGGFLGLLELLDDVRFDVLDESAAIIGGLLLYAAAFMMFWGAKQMSNTD